MATSDLSVNSLRKSFVEAESAIRDAGLLVPVDGIPMNWDYAVYRLGDQDYYSVGLSWESDIEGHFYSAKYKLDDKTVTDYYLIYPQGYEFYSSQIDPVSKDLIANYRRAGNEEPKLDPVDGIVLQHNTYGPWWELPEAWLKSLNDVNMPLLEQVFCRAKKPYGDCVEIDVHKIFPQDVIVMDNWHFLRFKNGQSGQVRIDNYGAVGQALFHDDFADGEQIWMSNRSEQVMEMFDQVENAYGRVLCTGLGLGIIPMLIAQKTSVKKVVVLENNPHVIKLFEQQTFNKDKLEIIQCDVRDYHSEEKFDWIMMDHYNDPISWEFLVEESKILRENTGNVNAKVIPYAWKRLLPLTKEKGISLNMPLWDQQDINRYFRPDDKDRSLISSLLRDISV